MTTSKLSATVDDELLAAVRRRAGRRGLSAFVDRALRNELRRISFRELLDDLADDIGPPDEALVAEANAALDDLARKTSEHRASSRLAEPA